VSATRPPDDPIGIALDIARRITALGVSYAITGSLASAVHGEPRAALDVDLFADLDATTGRGLSDALRDTYYVDADLVQRMAQSGGSFNAIHIASAIKVDVFVTGDDPFEQERLRRRVRIDIPDGSLDHLWVDSAECTVLRKLEWYRRGGEVSERQWRDVLAILRIQRQALDVAVLDLWAPRLGVADLLATARRAAG
jgi:hypothetical protein